MSARIVAILSCDNDCTVEYYPPLGVATIAAARAAAAEDGWQVKKRGRPDAPDRCPLCTAGQAGGGSEEVGRG